MTKIDFCQTRPDFLDKFPYLSTDKGGDGCLYPGCLQTRGGMDVYANLSRKTVTTVIARVRHQGEKPLFLYIINFRTVYGGNRPLFSYLARVSTVVTVYMDDVVICRIV